MDTERLPSLAESNPGPDLVPAPGSDPDDLRCRWILPGLRSWENVPDAVPRGKRFSSKGAQRANGR